jgi:hypothetical protein
LQLQDSAGSDEEIDTLSSSKTALVCKLAQVPPEIWMTLSLEAKKWLLNERKRQQQEAAKVMRFAYVKSEENLSDILTKSLSNERFHHLVKNWLFPVPEIKK